MKKLLYIDLFCGAGGTSTGVNSARLNGEQCADVIACVNHDANAIASHASNHPDALHFTEDIRTLELSPLVEHLKKCREDNPGALVVLWASLECTNFSKAKGGQPRDADSRTLAEHLFRYIEAIAPDYIQIENVEEFMSWGEVDENGKPVSMDKGKSYTRWVRKVKSYGYRFDHRILNAADYGAYTSRKRFFGIFAKGGLPIVFPRQTHDKNGTNTLFGSLAKWKPVKMPNMKELQEKAFRDNVSESTKKMIERLTLDEQMRVSFVPLIITHLAWVYADKAMACAARDKVSLLKKLSRTLKMVHQKYNEELRRELDYNHLQNVIRQTEMCISEINRDLTILYFSVNQELKRKVPQYGFDEQRTYAVISTLFIDLLKKHNREMDKLLAEKLNDRNLAPSIVPPLIQHLHTGMVAFAGVEGKFDYREQNVVTAMKVIKNRIDSIEFSVF